MKFFRSALCLPALTLTLTSLANAQDAAPQGTMKQDAASTGKTDVAGTGFEKVAAKEKDPKHISEAKVLAGGLLATGNARSLAATASGQFLLRREDNQFMAAAAVNYGRAAATPADEQKTNVENYQGKVRYDRFITDDFSAFLSVSGRRDRFQQLDLRLNIDPGVAYYWVNTEPTRVWNEAGYDLQYDLRDQDAVEDPTTNLDRNEVRHGVRLFAGLDHKFNENVGVNTGLEYLQAVTESKYWRLNWDAGLTSKIGANFSLATTFTLRYDNSPLPNVKKTDTLSSVSLIYQML